MSNMDFYDDNVTVQWINDIKYMSPSTHPNHGIVYSNIFNELFNYLKGKKCTVFPDKVDLILSNPDYAINIKDLYLSKGVKEYWIVNYFEKTITTCYDNKECEYSFDDAVKVNIFSDLSICLKDMELLEIYSLYSQ